MGYTLDDVRKEYNRLDLKCNVNTMGIKLSISYRCIRRYGLCRYGSDGRPSEIIITDFVLEEEDLFWNVIRHEYAHALVRLRCPGERHGHDEVFYAACREVGCPPTRCLDNVNSTIIEKKKQAKYIVTCNSCGYVWIFYRRSSTVRSLQSDPHSKICPYCKDSKFTVKQMR